MMNNKKIKASLKFIIEGLIRYCNENDIKSVMLNPNENSLPLVKRLKENGIEVELEDLVTITPISSLHGSIYVDEVINDLC